MLSKIIANPLELTICDYKDLIRKLKSDKECTITFLDNVFLIKLFKKKSDLFAGQTVHELRSDFGNITIRVTLKKLAILSHGIVDEFIDNRSISTLELLDKYSLSARPYGFYVEPDKGSRFYGLGTLLFNLLIEYCKIIGTESFLLSGDQTKKENGTSFYSPWGIEDNKSMDIREIKTFPTIISLK